MKEDIIRIAREAGLHLATDVNWMPIIGIEYAERFAAFVADAEAKRMHDEGMVTVGYMREQIAAERELIAQSMDKQADLAADEIDRQWAQEMAAAIRARGQA